MMQIGDGFRFSTQENMTPEGGFKDSWKWSLPVLAGGGAACLFTGMYMAVFGALNDHIDKRVDWLLQAGIALGIAFGGAARYDANSRRRAVVSYETTKMQVSATRKADLDDAAG